MPEFNDFMFVILTAVVAFMFGGLVSVILLGTRRMGLEEAALLCHMAATHKSTHLMRPDVLCLELASALEEESRR